MEPRGDLASRRDVTDAPPGAAAYPDQPAAEDPVSVAPGWSSSGPHRTGQCWPDRAGLPARHARARDRAVSTTGQGRCVTRTGCPTVIVKTAFGDRWPSGHPTLSGWPGS